MARVSADFGARRGAIRHGEERLALPLREQPNELYQAKKFEKGRPWRCTQRLSASFSIGNIMRDKMTQGVLLGTLEERDRHAQSRLCASWDMLPFSLKSALPRCYLSDIHYFAHRLPAVISGNAHFQ